LDEWAWQSVNSLSTSHETQSTEATHPHCLSNLRLLAGDDNTAIGSVLELDHELNAGKVTELTRAMPDLAVRLACYNVSPPVNIARPHLDSNAALGFDEPSS
jgi:hypothetical protein